jgi:hypothetical protein
MKFEELRGSIASMLNNNFGKYYMERSRSTGVRLFDEDAFVGMIRKVKASVDIDDLLSIIMRNTDQIIIKYIDDLLMKTFHIDTDILQSALELTMADVKSPELISEKSMTRACLYDAVENDFREQSQLQI